MPTVTTIPATLQRFTGTAIEKQSVKKVAAYARVSTDQEEQLSSFENQVDYYTRYIASHEGWTLVKVYADEGLSGTNTRLRAGFQEMMNDALSGHIDLILTKSVSRLARNTLDSLNTVRTLKDAGVEIYFEKENIWTFDSKGELLLTIMSSLAQEESRSISTNVKWGKQKLMKDGVSKVSYSRFLGYDKDFVINPEEAKVVKLIYSLFLKGLSIGMICKELEKRGIKTVTGKDRWAYSTIRSILTNEKYKGDSLLQKFFTPDIISTQKKNRGEMPMYYIERHHEAIIPPETFDAVQIEIKKRLDSKKCLNRNYLSRKVVCGDCGAFFIPKTWHSNNKYKKCIFACMDKYSGGKSICSSPHLSEEELQAVFLKALDQLENVSGQVIANLEVLISIVSDSKLLEDKREDLNEEIQSIELKMNRLIRDSAMNIISLDDYNSAFTESESLREEKQIELNHLESQLDERKIRIFSLQNMLLMLKEKGLSIQVFDEELFSAITEKIVVNSLDDIEVRFIDGSCIKTVV